MRKRVIDPATIRPEQRSEQEWLDLEKAAEAYLRMMRNETRFRMVLMTGQ
jgi:hypothetical protein